MKTQNYLVHHVRVGNCHDASELIDSGVFVVDETLTEAAANSSVPGIFLRQDCPVHCQKCGEEVAVRPDFVVCHVAVCPNCGVKRWFDKDEFLRFLAGSARMPVEIADADEGLFL